jgi:hypothetical protein
MTKHLKRIPASFDKPENEETANAEVPADAGAPAEAEIPVDAEAKPANKT